MTTSYLEKSLEQPYEAWRAKPSPQTTADLLRAVSPILQKATRSFVGDDNPLLRSKARQLALRALQTYNPSQSALRTHLTNHLQGLRRAMAQQQQVVRIPERLSLDAKRVFEAKLDLEEQLGREPSDIELADATGLSPKRLASIRKLRMPLAEGTMEAMTQTEENTGLAPSVTSLGNQKPDPALELVYADADDVSRVILEHGFGLHGKPKLSNQEIARLLKVTPSAVSQRKLQLQRKIDEAAQSGLL